MRTTAALSYEAGRYGGCLGHFLFAMLVMLATNRAVAATIDVDFGAPAGEVEWRGSGVLHSMTGNEPPDALVEPLRLRFWRGADLLDAPLYRRLARYQAEIHYVLSDDFIEQHVPIDNWQHWRQKWREYMDLKLKTFQRNGWQVVWEPWNEPDDTGFWPGDFTQYLDAFHIAFDAARAVQPDAVLAGPSLSAIDWREAREKIRQFLAYCSAEKLSPVKLTWHEFDDGRPADVVRHVQEVRGMARAFPAVDVRGLYISEMTTAAQSLSPGHLIVALKYLDDAGVDGVGRSCWQYGWGQTCIDDSLDGAVCRSRDCGADHDGGFAPRSLWWANQAYARLSGRRYKVSSSDPGITGMASRGRDGKTGDTIVIVVGFSKAAGPSGPQHVVLNLAKLGGVRRGLLTVERIRSTEEQALISPAVISQRQVDVAGEALSIDLPSYQPGDAYVVTLAVTAS